MRRRAIQISEETRKAAQIEADEWFAEAVKRADRRYQRDVNLSGLLALVIGFFALVVKTAIEL